MNIRKTRAYISWKAMNTRCNNPNAPKYLRYGGRGISICAEWKRFENFYADMGERDKDQTLDRIDNDGDYCKDNCRWATVKEQNRNRAASIKFRGENATDASIRLGGCRNLVAERLKLGWSLEDAFNTPANKFNSYTLKIKNKSDIVVNKSNNLIDSLI